MDQAWDTLVPQHTERRARPAQPRRLRMVEPKVPEEKEHQVAHANTVVMRSVLITSCVSAMAITKWRTRQDLNLQHLDPKSSALSN